MTRLMGFELRKVWMGRLFALLVAVLASANLLLLWMGARPSAGQPSAESWRRRGAGRSLCAPLTSARTKACPASPRTPPTRRWECGGCG